MDFGMLTPEINSGRMYTGPGSGSMIAAAAAWDGLAAELHCTAASYSSVISGLIVGWRGVSSATMAAEFARFTAWISTIAAVAEQTAAQARAAAAAYEIAFAATVPPQVIAANRFLLWSLIATNILGQNTPAIAATETHYAEMWAQDAVAMYDYGGQSATASQLTPLRPPPQITNLAGSAGQAAAVAHATGTHAQSLPELMSELPQTLQSLATPTSAAAADPPSLTTLGRIVEYALGPFDPFTVYDPFGAFYDIGLQGFLAPFNNYNMQMAYAGALGQAGLASGGVGPRMGVVGSTGWAVSAGMGRAGVVGSLSVPQGWASAAPAIRPLAAVLPETRLGWIPATAVADGQGSVFSNMALSSLAGRAVAGSGGSVARSVGTGAAASGGSATTATTATIIVIPED